MQQKARVISTVDESLPKRPQQGLPRGSTDDSTWWVKIVTQTPDCTYFFGPFESAGEAQHHESGYVEDLEQEGAQGIAVHILQDQPETLTIYDE
ncbi:MAG TPA: DUF1816 domain-containing protein [Waterburya sp.]